MKLNKEQITFIVVVLLVGWLAYGELTADGSKPRRRSKKRGLRQGVVEISELDTMKAALVSEGETSWTLAGRNVYRAPKEHVPMPPLNLPAPPRTTMVTGRPQTVPGPDPYSRLASVAVVEAASGVELPPRKEEPNAEDELDVGDDQVGEDLSGSELEFEESEPQEVAQEEDSAKKKNRIKKILGLRERLAQDAEEKIAKERAERQKLRDMAERRRTLDKIQWLSGETWHGIIMNDSELPEGSEGLDKYHLKLRIDEIRRLTNASETEIADMLGDRKLEIEFKRWDDKKWGAKSKVSPLNVRAIEFAEGKTPGIYTVDQFELHRRAAPLSDSKHHIELTSKLDEIGEFGLAKTHLLRLLDAGEQGLDLYRALALAANRAFDYNVEMRAVHEGLKKFPKDAQLMAGAAELYSRLGLSELAEDMFAKALRLAPRDAQVNARYGRHLAQSSVGGRARSIEAKQLLEKAASGRFELENERLTVLLDLGDAQMAAGGTDAASRAYEQVNTVQPDNIRALIGLANAAYAKGDTTSAKEKLNDALERSPETGLIYFNLAMCALKDEEWAQARDLFYDAMNADPFLTARAHCGLGYLHELIGKPEEAQAAYAAALEADPEDGEVLYWNGRGFLLIGDYAQAQEVLQKALLRIPDQFDILAALSDACFHLQEFDNALRYLDAAMALRPQSPSLLVRKAQTLVRLRRFTEAKACLDLSKQQKDTDEVELSLAYYYYLEGNHEEALKRFRTVERSLERRDESDLATYTRTYAAAIADNLAKLVWSDHFNRVATGRDLLRGWRSYAPGSGVSISLVDNEIAFSGTQKASDVPSCIFQRRSGREFVSFEAAITAMPDSEQVCGIGIFTFRKNTNNQNPFVDIDSGGIVYDGMIVGKNREGRLAYRIISRYEMGRWQTIPETWPAAVEGKAQAVVLGIASENSKKGTFSVLVNGNPVVTGIEIKGLRRTAKDLQLWAFTQAEIDRRVDAKVDDVRIVTRDNKRR